MLKTTTTTPFHSDIKAIKFRLRPSTIDYVIFLFLQVSSIRCCAIKLLPLSQPVKQHPTTIALFAKDCKYNIPTITRSGQHEGFSYSTTPLHHFSTIHNRMPKHTLTVTCKPLGHEYNIIIDCEAQHWSCLSLSIVQEDNSEKRK